MVVVVVVVCAALDRKVKVLSCLKNIIYFSLSSLANEGFHGLAKIFLKQVRSGNSESIARNPPKLRDDKNGGGRIGGP